MLALLAASLYIMTSRVQAPANSPPSVPQSSAPVRPPVAESPSRSAPSGGPSKLGVGAWNIEWLGQPGERSGDGRDTPQSPSHIAECIAFTEVAVLGLAEIIATGNASPPTSLELDATIPLLNELTNGDWTYELNPGQSAGDQLTGFMWNRSVVQAVDIKGDPWGESDDPRRLAIAVGRGPTGNPLWHRPPHAMKFSAGAGLTDVVVVPVHMKADYRGDFAAHRAQEASAMAASLAKLRSEFRDSDILVVGDTNCASPLEPALTVFAEAGLVDRNMQDEATHWRGGSMDRILFTEGQPEFAAAAFNVASPGFLDKKRWDARDFKRNLSDHFPVFTTITITIDDD